MIMTRCTLRRCKAQVLDGGCNVTDNPHACLDDDREELLRCGHRVTAGPGHGGAVRLDEDPSE